MNLSEQSKKNLLALARRTIELQLLGSSKIEVNEDDSAFDLIAGAFVTLHKRGNLRGCIGHITGILPLKETIAEMALASAFSDPRFPQLNQDELPEIEIEITVLSPLKEARADEVEIGLHGVVITKGANKGLLLPQVATEYQMDRETFLAHTCLKAGLHKNAWQEKGVKIEIFTGMVFAEK